MDCHACGAPMSAGHVLCAQCGTPVPGAEPPRVGLDDRKADCSRCHALCCVALAFDWPNYKKPAGVPCKHLRPDFTCGRWDTLEEDGFVFCRGFECHGAGQATADTVSRACGGNWRDTPAAKDYELGTFQKVFSAVYEHANGRPPKRHDT